MRRRTRRLQMRSTPIAPTSRARAARRSCGARTSRAIRTSSTLRGSCRASTTGSADTHRKPKGGGCSSRASRRDARLQRCNRIGPKVISGRRRTWASSPNRMACARESGIDHRSGRSWRRCFESLRRIRPAPPTARSAAGMRGCRDFSAAAANLRKSISARR